RNIEHHPKIEILYIYRRYVYISLNQPNKSEKDFQTAIQLQPDYGEAHLGLAFSYLQLHRPRAAVPELDMAKKHMGENRIWHLARAEAFRQEQNFGNAEKEYRVALKEDPNDLTTQMALGETQFRLRHYSDSI